MNKYQKPNIELRKSYLKGYIHGKFIHGDKSQKNIYLLEEVVAGKRQEVDFRHVGNTLLLTLHSLCVCVFPL